MPAPREMRPPCVTKASSLKKAHAVSRLSTQILSTQVLSTHVLDLVSGKPASGVRIELHRLADDGSRHLVTASITNADGRTDTPLMAGAAFATGTYELNFHIGPYFAARGQTGFLDIVPIRFVIDEPAGHYHVPLLASPWSYSTYRGS